MGFFTSFLGKGFGRSKARTLYKRGMAKAGKRDHAGAIDDYSAAIALADSQPDVKAMALYNRALVHSSAKNYEKAIDDLKVVLVMDELPNNVRTAAERKLERIIRRSKQSSKSES